MPRALLVDSEYEIIFLHKKKKRKRESEGEREWLEVGGGKKEGRKREEQKKPSDSTDSPVAKFFTIISVIRAPATTSCPYYPLCHLASVVTHNRNPVCQGLQIPRTEASENYHLQCLKSMTPQSPPAPSTAYREQE